MRKREIRDFAKQLVTLSLDEERQVCSERVHGVLEALQAKPPRQLKVLLKEYLRQLRRELRQTQALVEYAGDISSATLESIAAEFTHITGRKVTAVSEANPKLIAGVRIRVGDDVYEDTITSRLAALSLPAY